LYKIHSKEKSLRVIFYFIIYTIIHEALGYYFHEIGSMADALVLLSIYTAVEFSTFCLFYFYSVSEGLMKKAVLPIGGLFLVFAGIDFFLVNQMTAIDSMAIGVESILIILMCIYYLIVQIKGSSNLFVYSTSNFWIVITFLIFFSGTFFLYIMLESQFEDKSYRTLYTFINSIFYILRNILFSVAMVMKSSQPAKKKVLSSNFQQRLG